jgi:hypothetical protein
MTHTEPPCDHDGAWIGTVSAGGLTSGPHCSVVTCEPCVTRSQGYVQMVTGCPANPFTPFAKARNRR